MASLALLEALAHNPWLPASPHLAAAATQAMVLATDLAKLISAASYACQQQHAGPGKLPQAPTPTPSPMAIDPPDPAPSYNNYSTNLASQPWHLGCRTWGPMPTGLSTLDCRQMALNHPVAAPWHARQLLHSRHFCAHHPLINGSCGPFSAGAVRSFNALSHTGFTPAPAPAFTRTVAGTAQITTAAAAGAAAGASSVAAAAAGAAAGASSVAAAAAATAGAAADATSVAAARQAGSTKPPGTLDFRLPHVANPVTIWKRPQDAVGRDSKLLAKYIKNLKPKALVQRVMVRPGINSLPDLLKLYQNKIDAITVAAVLTKISITLRHTKREDQVATQDVARQVLSWLEPYMRFQVRYASVQALSTVLWAWASLPEELQGVWPKDLAALMFVRACQPHASGDALQHKLRGEAPKVLAQLSWGAAKLIDPAKVNTDPLLQYAVSALVRYAGRRINQFSPLGLALVSDSLASLSPAQAHVFLKRKVAPEAARRIGLITERQFNTATLVRVLRACAAAQVRHIPFYEKAAAAALPQLPGWKARHVLQLAEAFAQVGVRHEGLMAAVARHAEQWPVTLQTCHMGPRVTKACQQLNCKPPTLRAVKPQQRAKQNSSHTTQQQSESVSSPTSP